MHRSVLAKTAASMLTAVTVLLFFVYPANAEFRNTPITAQIPVVVKTEVSGKDKYEVVIEGMDSASPMPEKSTLVFKGAGEKNIGIVIDEPGTYQYKVYERAGKNKKIIYDDTTYTVTVFVTQDDNGILDAKVILSKGGLFKPSAAKFTNKEVEDPDHNPYVPATGEAMSKFIPYAAAAFAIGGVILILALRRRKEEADG